MEKIKLNDGTIFDIVSGSYEYVNIIAPSVDEVVSCFTDANLKYCEILADVVVNEIVGEEGTKPVGLCGSGIIDVIAELFVFYRRI